MWRRPSPRSLTDTLQGAVLANDGVALGRLVHDRFLFTSTRVDRRIDKAAWIGWACATPWASFRLDCVRTVDLDTAKVVEVAVDQAVGGAGPSSSRWLVTDVWAWDAGDWRLAARHPELQALSVPDGTAESGA